VAQKAPAVGRATARGNAVCLKRPQTDSIRRVRFQHVVQRLYGLGPRALCELLFELGADHDIADDIGALVRRPPCRSYSLWKPVRRWQQVSRER
jgi:hypothetical protein